MGNSVLRSTGWLVQAAPVADRWIRQRPAVHGFPSLKIMLAASQHVHRAMYMGLTHNVEKRMVPVLLRHRHHRRLGPCRLQDHRHPHLQPTDRDTKGCTVASFGGRYCEPLVSCSGPGPLRSASGLAPRAGHRSGPQLFRQIAPLFVLLDLRLIAPATSRRRRAPLDVGRATPTSPGSLFVATD